MKSSRPYRAYEVYASPCIDCGEEIESREMPVPLRCPGCQIKHDRTLLRDKPSAVRSTTGS